MLFDITDNLSYEIYALVILQSPFTYANQIVKHTIDDKLLETKYFRKAESPDLQSTELDLGIEVTVGMSETEIIDSKTFSSVVKDAKNIDDVKSNLSKADKKGIFKGEISQQGDFYIMNHDQPDNLSLLEKVIRKKVKSSSGYKNFLDNWLFVYFVGYLQKDKIPEVIRNIPGHEFFTRYIINPLGNSDGIWYIDAPYLEASTYWHTSMSNDMIIDEVEKIRKVL